MGWIFLSALEISEKGKMIPEFENFFSKATVTKTIEFL